MSDADSRRETAPLRPGNGRSGRLLVIGVAALVLIAGAVFVGSRVAGSRSGSATTSCAEGGSCVIGDVGPGGGRVFYDAGSQQVWGRYLEAAPATWFGGTADRFVGWGRPVAVTTETGIGTGLTNTVNAVSAMGATTATPYAVYDARNYAGGGKTDWFVPSLDELRELYKQRLAVGGLRTDNYAYYSSTQSITPAGSNKDQFVDAVYFTNGQEVASYRAYGGFVRPIRAF